MVIQGQISKENHILLTGATGFLGQYLYKYLSDDGYNVIATSSRDLEGYKKLDITHNLIELDIDQPIHTIIHNAGLIKGSRKDLFLVNAVGTKKIIQLAKKLGVQRLVLISSIDTIVDNDSVNSTSYAKSKKEAEEYVMQSELQYCIIRPSVVFGPDINNFRLLETAIKKLPLFPLPYGGKYIWQPVFVEDLAREIVIASTAAKLNNQINLVGPEDIPFSEIVEILEKYLEVDKVKLNIPSWIMNFISNIVGMISEDLKNNLFSSFYNKILYDNNITRCPTSLANYYSKKDLTSLYVETL